MTSKFALAIFFLGFCVTIGSFADEATQIIFALRLATDTALVSLLLSAGLLGGITASPVAPHIMAHFGPIRTISLVFLAQAALIFMASFANNFATYIIVATLLGGTGSLLWSAIMVAAPSFARNDRHIDRLNRAIQSVRNLGFVAGPVLGGMLFAMTDGTDGLLYIALFVLFAAPITIACFKAINRNLTATKNDTEKGRKGLDLRGLVQSPGVVRAISPLIVTVIITSALNVLLIVHVRMGLALSAETYGLLVGALSLGLIVGPMTLGPILARLGDAAGASTAAGMIGLGIASLAITNIVSLMLAATFIIGLANGAQNALMASFMMKTIDEANRIRQMPAYVLLLQMSVLSGFFGAGLVSNAYVAETLLTIGVVTTFLGAAGMAINFNNRPRLAAEGKNK